MILEGTTIVAVKRGGKTVIAGDGQVTAGQSVVLKNNAVKVRRMYNEKVVVGFAGSVADAFTLSSRVLNVCLVSCGVWLMPWASIIAPHSA